jgi:hypothetical protein
LASEHRLYVIVRKNIARPQRTVQAIHAGVCLLARYPEITANWDEIGPALIIYGVTGAQLKRLVLKLPNPSIQFHEPDWNMALTSAAYYGPKLEAFEMLTLL